MKEPWKEFKRKDYILYGINITELDQTLIIDNIELNQIQVAHIRNNLTDWMNDKRTRDKKRIRAQDNKI